MEQQLRELQEQNEVEITSDKKLETARDRAAVSTQLLISLHTIN
jgi:hypothetical protein